MMGAFKRRMQRSQVLVALVRSARSTRIRRRGEGSRRPIIVAYLGGSGLKKLQLGAGGNALDGWLNSDLFPRPHEIFVDVSRPLPFADRSFDYVFSEHQIEHILYPDGVLMLRECFRVLKPGGVLRIATPDLERILGLYAAEKTDVQQRYIRFVTDSFIPETSDYAACFVVNQDMRGWDHKFIYDFATLAQEMHRAGFVDVSRHEAGESGDDALRGLEAHGTVIGNEEMNAYETMAVEARRAT
jgi:predicted SAM-dependent methyltransferase